MPDTDTLTDATPEAIRAEAAARLDAITRYFLESGSVTDKTHDDLFFELEFENDWAYSDDPDHAIPITLLQLLQASTTRLQAAEPDADRLYIHHLIEYALIEQEGLRILAEASGGTGTTEFTEAHFGLLDAALRPYFSEHGRMALDLVGARTRGFPDLHDSPTLQFGQTPQEGDPETEAAFGQARVFLETITAHFMESDDLWQKTPADLAYELAYHNGWGIFEAQQREEAFEETSLQALLALSRRRIQAFKEIGENQPHYERAIRFIHGLIEKAIYDERTLESDIPSSVTLKTASSALSDELTSGK